MGTFRIAAFGVNTKSGIGAYAVGAGGVLAVPSNAQVITVVNKFPEDGGFWLSPGAGNPTGTILLIADAGEIYLDGSATSVTENELPLGFTVRTATIEGVGGISGDPVATLKLNLNGTLGATLPNLFPAVSTGAIPSLAFPSIPPLTLNGLLANFYGFTATNSGVLTPLVFNIYILGTYEQVNFSWTIGNGAPFDVPNTSPVIEGKLFGDAKRFTFTSGGGANGNAANIFNSVTNPLATGPSLVAAANAGSGISSIKFNWIDVTLGPQSVTVDDSDFDEWTSILISFLLPDTLPLDTLIDVEVLSDGFPAIPAPSGTGIQFSGSVKLGVIKILTTAASGIYKIVTNKRSDTIYTNAPTNDDTTEIAIPYPHGKTGFIGG